MRLFTFLILVFSVTARASLILPESQCGSVDIREVKPELREYFSTPLNQDSVGWCYGFVAADLLTAKNQKPVSAFHVSTLYNQAISRDLLWRILYDIGEEINEGGLGDIYEGGYIGRAMKAAQRNRSVCSEEQLPFDGDAWGGTRADLTRLENLRGLIRENTDKEVACEMIERVFPLGAFGNTNFEQIRSELSRRNINGALANIVGEACRENPVVLSEAKIKNMGRPSRTNRARQNYLSAINTSLTSGLPVGISWNTRGATGVSGRHASSVIARRWHNGKCQYKIRNSWGTSCYSYLPGIECNSPEGAFWINDDQFHEMVSGITVVE